MALSVRITVFTTAAGEFDANKPVSFGVTTLRRWNGHYIGSTSTKAQDGTAENWAIDGTPNVLFR